jgi:predicted nucleic acid-binding protein
VILVDADVILDVALDRTPHANASAAFLARLERRPYRAFVAWHTLANLYYLLRPSRGAGDARGLLLNLTTLLVVVPTNPEDFRFAGSLEMEDFEDAMQVAAARACGARVIATRNLRHYRRAPIEARTPAQLLEELR